MLYAWWCQSGATWPTKQNEAVGLQVERLEELANKFATTAGAGGPVTNDRVLDLFAAQLAIETAEVLEDGYRHTNAAVNAAKIGD